MICSHCYSPLPLEPTRLYVGVWNDIIHYFCCNAHKTEFFNANIKGHETYEKNQQ